ncbi:MAG: AsmA-like C-terminal region-containing protein [Bacteroidota bacterium]
MLKKGLKYLVCVLIALFSLIGIGMTYVYFNQDEIKDMAIQELNESINGSLNVKDAEASLLSSFPSVSINLEQPHLIAVADTLLACRELQLKLNLFDFINKDYRITELEVSDGLIELKTLENGELNFEVWKNDTLTSEREMQFAIESIQFNDVQVNYADLQTENQYTTHIKDLDAQLHLNHVNWDILLDGELNTFAFIEDTTTRILQEELELVTQFSFLEEENKLLFENISVINEESAIDAQGQLDLEKDKEALSLNIQTQSSAKGLLSIFEHYLTLPENYSYKAETEILSKLDYHFGNEESLKIENAVVLNKGTFTELNSKESLEDISFNGQYNYDNGISDLEIKKFVSEMAHGEFQVNGKIKKIPNADVNLNIQGALDLAELSNFLALDSILFHGEIDFNNVLLASLNAGDFKDQKWINKLEIGGNASLENGSIEWLEKEILLNSLNGKMTFSEDHVAVKDLNGDVGSSTFVLNGTISNLLKYAFLEDEILKIEAFLEADIVKLEEFLKESESQNSNSELSFPENIEFKLNSNISNLSFQKFEAQKIKGLITYKNKRFNANDISFNSCEGNFNGRISITEKSQNDFLVTSESQSKNLNIKEVFKEFGNFDQIFLTEEHISGQTDTDVFFQGNMDRFLEFNKKSIQAVADIRLTDGELIEHPSMLEIAQYLRKKRLLHPFLNIDEFEEKVHHLSFSEINNRIEIKNSKITIPQMEIKSNAMDCNIRGVHGFDNNIDYRLDFRMREMLKQHEEEIEGIIVEDDGTGSRIFIAMKGHVDDPDVSFDKESARAKRKSDLQKAKKDFLDIFRKKPGELEEEEIEIEVKDQAVVEKKQTKKKGLKKLFSRDEPEEEEALEIDIIDD